MGHDNSADRREREREHLYEESRRRQQRQEKREREISDRKMWRNMDRESRRENVSGINFSKGAHYHEDIDRENREREAQEKEGLELAEQERRRLVTTEFMKDYTERKIRIRKEKEKRRVRWKRNKIRIVIAVMTTLSILMVMWIIFGG